MSECDINREIEIDTTEYITSHADKTEFLKRVCSKLVDEKI